MQQQIAESTAQTVYLAILGRPATPGELDLWSARITTPSARYMTKKLMKSEEYRQSGADASDKSFVQAVIFNLFDREADASETASWLDVKSARDLGNGGLFRAMLAEAKDSDIEARDAKLSLAQYATDAARDGRYMPEDRIPPAGAVWPRMRRQS
ncbi:MAG: DUF4214 domain-containing protein [Henriciella sp.]|uniref:DUF4214 domain-containing protein n=1 Tax=Henriciella sp. TaxID=1968823 RepID=UPI003C7511E4